jgi:hypothetical protein
MIIAPTLRIPILLLFGLNIGTSTAWATEDAPNEKIPTYYFSLPIGEVIRLAAKDRDNACAAKSSLRLVHYLIPAKNLASPSHHVAYSNSLLARQYGPIDINGTRGRATTPDFYCATFPAARATVKNDTGCANAMATVADGPIRFCGNADSPPSAGHEPGHKPSGGFRGLHAAYGFNSTDSDPASDERQANKKKEEVNNVVIEFEKYSPDPFFSQ